MSKLFNGVKNMNNIVKPMKTMSKVPHAMSKLPEMIYKMITMWKLPKLMSKYLKNDIPTNNKYAKVVKISKMVKKKQYSQKKNDDKNAHI